MIGKENSINCFIKISLGFYAVFILLLLTLWFNLHNNIVEIKTQNNNNYSKILASRYTSTFNVEFTKFNNKLVLIEPKEIDKINNHIIALTEQVQKETNRAESIIDKDLDRLNLYMAIGIAFMTLLGIFVPVSANILSVQDLRDKQKEISDKLKSFEDQKPDIEKALNDSKTAISNSNSALEKSEKLDNLSQKITSVSEITNKVLPDVNNLILQNAIARFFNISPIVLTNARGEKNFLIFMNLLIPIKNGFESYLENLHHPIQENSNFIQIINDFKLFLAAERFRFQSIFNKRDDKDFESLINLLSVLETSSTENIHESCKAVIGQIDKIIKKFSTKDHN